MLSPSRRSPREEPLLTGLNSSVQTHPWVSPLLSMAAQEPVTFPRPRLSLEGSCSHAVD